MPKPAVWDGDPECGHEVQCAYQTHYCTYIRVPRLLTLQRVQSPDELLLLTAYQWYELWFKVLRADLHTALNADCATREPVVLLRRGIELWKLLDHHADLAETVLADELELKKALDAADVTAVSDQFAQLQARAAELTRLESKSFPGLAAAAREYRARLRSFGARFQKFLAETLIPSPPGPRPLPTYGAWLDLPRLLNLQNGVKEAWTPVGQQPGALWEPEHIRPDENMFVIVHQCFELWFKVILDQVDRAVPALLAGDVAEAARRARYIVLIQRLLVQQIQIPETMLPLDFMRFRNQKVERDGQVLVTGLSPASGTESYQFREIEIVCGLRDDPVFRNYLHGNDRLPVHLLTPRQAERLEQPTLPEAFRCAVQARGVERLDDIFTLSDVPNPHADLAELADLLIQFDEFFRLWRINHVSMVEKMIGFKSGTGFLGPEYLRETVGIQVQEKNRVLEERQVRPRFFEDLWAVRTRMGAY